jgi:hypothetical protein
MVADFTLGLSQMQAGKDGVTVRRPAPKPNEFYKVSLCKHFLSGDCPFGEGCHFAHGEAELRKYPKPGQEAAPGAEEGEKELGDNMFGNQETTTVDYFQVSCYCGIDCGLCVVLHSFRSLCEIYML